MDIRLQGHGHKVWVGQTNCDNVDQIFNKDDRDSINKTGDVSQNTQAQKSNTTGSSLDTADRPRMTSTIPSTDPDSAPRSRLVTASTRQAATRVPSIPVSQHGRKNSSSQSTRLPLARHCIIEPVSSPTITTLNSTTIISSLANNQSSSNQPPKEQSLSYGRKPAALHNTASDTSKTSANTDPSNHPLSGNNNEASKVALNCRSDDVVRFEKDIIDNAALMPLSKHRIDTCVMESSSVAPGTTKVSCEMSVGTAARSATEKKSVISASTTGFLARSDGRSLHAAVEPTASENGRGLSTSLPISMSFSPNTKNTIVKGTDNAIGTLEITVSRDNTLESNNNHEPRLKPRSSFGGVRMKSRPKKKSFIMSATVSSKVNDIKADEEKHGSTDGASEPDESRSTEEKQKPIGANPEIFSWELYLELVPAISAPKDAFNQPIEYPKNNFVLNMKLEVCDPRNVSVWGLASVVGIEGLYLRLRFENTDKSNDVIELIDSEKIRPVGSAGEVLAPVGYKGNIANYSRFVEKILSDPATVIASADLFPPRPKPPKKNLFQVGMKLEAVDLKHRDLVCPATIGQVDGDTVRITFDGWTGSFDYNCNFRSRDLFPINWCRDTGHYMQPPNGWENLVKSGGSKFISSTGKLQSDRASKISRPNLTSRHQHSHKPTSNQALYKSYAKHDASSKNASSQVQGPNKPRGRPPKDPAKLAVNQARNESPLSLSHKTKALKKDLIESKSAVKEVNLHEDLEANNTSPSPTLDEVMSPEGSCAQIDRFRCQRMVPYDLWRQKQKDQMPQDISKVLESSATDEASIPSSDNSASLSLASVEQTPTSTDTSDIPRPKKLKSSNLDESETSDRITRVLSSKPNNVSSWSIGDIIDLISTDEALAKYSTVFMENEIDGKAFILLTKEILLKHMGFKIGPYLKIADLIDKVKNMK